MTQQSEFSHPAPPRRPLPLHDWPLLSPSMKAFEVGSVLWATEHLVGQVMSFENVREIPTDEHFDQGVVATALSDLPGILFEVMRPQGRLLFVLNTSLGQILFIVEKEADHFRVLKKINDHYAAYAEEGQESFSNNLSQLYTAEGSITIWPQGTMNLSGNLVVGRDMIFKVG